MCLCHRFVCPMFVHFYLNVLKVEDSPMIEIVDPDVPFCHKIHQHVTSSAFADMWGPEIATEHRC